MNDIMEKKKKVILELMNDKTYIPMKFKELAVVLNITKENRDQLEEVLSELLEERKISITKKGKYDITKEHYIEGYFISNDRGFGSLKLKDRMKITLFRRIRLTEHFIMTWFLFRLRIARQVSVRKQEL